MSTWTRMKIEELVKFEWGDMLHLTVTCKTLYGDLNASVERLKERVQDKQILAPIRAIYEDMLEWADNENKKMDTERFGKRGSGVE